MRTCRVDRNFCFWKGILDLDFLGIDVVSDGEEDKIIEENRMLEYALLDDKN